MTKSSSLGLPGLFAAIAACLGAISANAQLPQAKTQTAGPVRATTATLNGMGVPKGNATTAWFEWGTDRNYGNTTTPQNIGSGNGVVRVSAPLVGLTEGGVYHFRLVASNSVGVTYGFDFMFTTAMKVQNWGSFNASGIIQYPDVPAGLTNLSGIACGHRHGLAIRNDGTVAAWLVVSFSPFLQQTNIPPGLTNVVAVAGGFSHCLALKEDGTVVGWGLYSGTSTANNPTNVPADLTNAIAIGGGDRFGAALKSDGKLVVWGPDASFCGPANSIISNVIAISCGTEHIIALKADGTVSVWGCGIGAAGAPSSATNVVAIATMALWNIALRGDGTTVEWGGGGLPSDVPKPADLTNAVAVLTGYAYAEALRADGTVVGWGSAQEATNVPAGLSNVVAFASGDYHRVGLAPVNLPPKARGRAITGSINTPLTLSLSTTRIFDPNGDPFLVRITSLPAKGTLYQYTAGGPGAAITTPGTVITDAGYRAIFMPLPNDYGAPYATFTLVANDGEFDSEVGNWTVNISAPPRPSIQTVGITNGPPIAFALSFTGISNTSYSVWYSATLSSWTYLGPATQVSPGQFSFSDYTITNSPVRFYRVQFP